jgi:hypothetical protein
MGGFAARRRRMMLTMAETVRVARMTNVVCV